MEKNQRCSICIRECEIGNSYCHRRDENGNLKHGNRLCAISTDHLFDKPIIHFEKNVKTLSVGSWGCNLRCLGCQNVHLSWTTTGDGLGYTEMQPEDIVGLALENDCKCISYTYNEPAVHLDTVEKIAYKAQEKGLFNVFVTNSTLTEKSTKRIALCMDAVAADIKSLKNDFYYEYCGAKGINDVADKILHCIRTFSDAGCHVEVRTNIIPGANDQEEDYRGIASWIRHNMGITTPWHITRFFPANKLDHFIQTPAGSLLKAQQIGLDEGLKYVQTFFSKGCDCAKENCMVGSEPGYRKATILTCCK